MNTDCIYHKSNRPSEVIALQRKVIEEQDGIIELLKGALAAAGVEETPHYGEGFENLTSQERAIMGALFKHYPRPLSQYALLEMMPGHDHAADRVPQLVNVKVCHIRKKLGHDAVRTVNGLGYALGDALYRDMKGDRVQRRNGSFQPTALAA